jgi:hypothetical protein
VLVAGGEASQRDAGEGRRHDGREPGQPVEEPVPRDPAAEGQLRRGLQRVGGEQPRPRSSVEGGWSGTVEAEVVQGLAHVLEGRAAVQEAQALADEPRAGGLRERPQYGGMSCRRQLRWGLVLDKGMGEREQSLVVHEIRDSCRDRCPVHRDSPRVGGGAGRDVAGHARPPSVLPYGPCRRSGGNPARGHRRVRRSLYQR